MMVKKYNVLLLLLPVFIFCINFSITRAVPNVADILAEQGDNLSEDEKEDLEEEFETLDEKAAKYRRMINLKQKQQDTLENQLDLMELQAENLENDIDLKEEEIKKNEQNIKEIEAKIAKKEEEISLSKKHLSEMLRTYSRIEKEISLEFLSSRGNLSEIFNKSAYLSQASQKVQGSLTEIKQKRTELNSRKEEFEGQKKELEKNKQELEDKIYYLNNEKYTKKIILEKTKGEEGKYQELLSRVEAQKQELLGGLDELSAEQRGDLDEILKAAKKPKDGLASTSWYYSQKDPKWAYNRIGLSSSLMKDYGCAVTALAMIFTYYDEDITPGKLAGQPIFYRDLIVWPSYWKGLELDSSTAHGSVSWSTVDKELKKDNPVIVFVRARGGKGHYVVIHHKDDDKYVVHDPLFGANIYLSTTKSLVGSVYNSSTTVDQAIYYED